MAIVFLAVTTEHSGESNALGLLFQVYSMIFSIFYFPAVFLIFIILALSPSRPQLHQGFDVILPRENKQLKR